MATEVLPLHKIISDTGVWFRFTDSSQLFMLGGRSPHFDCFYLVSRYGEVTLADREDLLTKSVVRANVKIMEVLND